LNAFEPCLPHLSGGSYKIWKSVKALLRIFSFKEFFLIAIEDPDSIRALNRTTEQSVKMYPVDVFESCSNCPAKFIFNGWYISGKRNRTTQFSIQSWLVLVAILNANIPGIGVLPYLANPPHFVTTMIKDQSDFWGNWLSDIWFPFRDEKASRFWGPTRCLSNSPLMTTSVATICPYSFQCPSVLRCSDV